MRKCGSCTLCCRLLPVPEFGKLDNQRCQHQCSKGCRIYATRPISCAVWNCRWLAGDDTGQRPDRCHYVVDMMPDYVIKTHTETGEEIEKMPVIQIWVEPGHDVRNDPNLRAFLDREHRMGLLRDGALRGFMMIPPSLTDDGQWLIMNTNLSTEPSHSFEQICEALGGAQFEVKVVVPQDRIRKEMP